MEFKDKAVLYCFREVKCKQGFTTGSLLGRRGYEFPFQLFSGF